MEAAKTSVRTLFCEKSELWGQSIGPLALPGSHSVRLVQFWPLILLLKSSQIFLLAKFYWLIPLVHSVGSFCSLILLAFGPIAAVKRTEPRGSRLYSGLHFMNGPKNVEQMQTLTGRSSRLPSREGRREGNEHTLPAHTVPGRSQVVERSVPNLRRERLAWP